MDDLEADQMFRLEGFDALCLSHNPDTDHRLVNIDDSATVKAERCEVIHNHATEVNLLARAMSPNQSTTVSACRKSFLDLPGEIRNLIYGQICNRCDNGELAIRKQRTGYQELSIVDNEGSRPLAIFGVNRQIRHEFLTFWLLSHTSTTATMCSAKNNLDFSMLITAHMTFSNLVKLQVSASYRSYSRSGGARISLMFGPWKSSELTPSSKDRIAISIAEIFQTSDDINLDKFLLAADKFFALSLEVIVHPYERCFGPRFHTTFNVERTFHGEVPGFSTEG